MGHVYFIFELIIEIEHVIYVKSKKLPCKLNIYT